MNDFDLDNPYHRNRQAKRKFPILLIGCIISSATLIFAYANDLLPHYTATIDGTTITLIRDDPRYLAEQAALEAEANRQIYRINGVEVSQAEYEQALAQLQAANTAQQNQSDQIQVAEQNNSTQQAITEQSNQPDYANGQTRKCIDGQGKVVYQTDTCSSKGYKTEKMIGAMDGAVSTATYSYKQEEQRQQPTTRAEQPAREAQVVSMGGDQQAQQTRHSSCDHLERRREWIRTQQRYNSTQGLRDEYTYVSKEWQRLCLGSQGMS